MALRNISDTALWVAVYRARESERPDAVFHDPLARRLAGEKGEEIARLMEPKRPQDWPFVARTVLFDRMVTRGIDAGADTVLNLAAGLDTRPWRMDLPSSLHWIEVDLPDMIRYKQEMLKDETPRCRVDHVAVDLADRHARSTLFAEVGSSARQVLVVTEGLLIYLEADAVDALARDLAAQPTFKHWTLDMTSPGLLCMLQKQWGQRLDNAAATLRFAPEEGPGFFVARGWKPIEIGSLLKTAGRLKRLPFPLNIFAKLPEPKKLGKKVMWSGIGLFEKG